MGFKLSISTIMLLISSKVLAVIALGVALNSIVELFKNNIDIYKVTCAKHEHKIIISINRIGISNLRFL